MLEFFSTISFLRRGNRRKDFETEKQRKYDRAIVLQMQKT